MVKNRRRPHNKLSGEKIKIFFAFIVGVLALLLIGFYTFINTYRYKETSNWVNHTHEVISETQNIFSYLQDIETSARGYAIAGSDLYLKPYHNAIDHIDESVYKVTFLTKDNKEQQQLFDSLHTLISLKIIFSSRVIGSGKKVNSNAAIQLVAGGEGERLMEKCRTLVGEIINNERKLLSDRLAEAARNFDHTIKVILTSVLISVTFVLIIFIFFVKDYNKRLQSEAALQQYKYFFNNSHELACIANMDGYFEVLNPKYEEVLGYSKEELSEKKFIDFIHPDDIDSTLNEVKKLESGAPTVNFINRYCTKAGNYIWFDWNSTPDPKTGKIYAVARDITERRKAEATLLENERQLNEAQAIAHVGSWSAHIPTNTIIWSDEIYRIYGLRPQEIKPDFEAFLRFVHAEDREMVTNCLKKASQDKKPFRFEHRIIRNDGEERIISASGKVICDKDGNAIMMHGTNHDITEQKEVEKKLAEAKELAEQSALLKETFLANMSHEIRTPMNAIIGFTDILYKGNLGPKEKDYVKTIKNAGENLMRLINDILDLSKINAQMMDFEERPLSIKEIFRSLSEMYRVSAEDKKLEMTFNYQDNLPDILLGDPTRLTQILTNLIGNAIKFTHKGKIEVNAKVLNKGRKWCIVEFSIKDTGIGIPKAGLKDIFERFRQAETGTTRKYGGTGLGLSIAKQLVELQGGEMKVTSKENIGSEFIFTLPFNPEKQPGSLVRINKEGNFITKKLKGLKILLAEDNPVNINLILNLFSEHEIHTDVAENGKIVIEKIKNHNYDMILMDIQMPEMNGYEATTVIRKELHNEIPIIAMTAHAMAGEQEKSLQLGMNDYISKPINANMLFEKIYNVTLAAADNGHSKKTERITNLTYLEEIMGGKKELIGNTIDVFLKQCPEDLALISDAVKKENYSSIRKYAHRMKSTVSIVGAEKMEDILEKLESLSVAEQETENINSLFGQLDLLCSRVIEEIKTEKEKYS